MKICTKCKIEKPDTAFHHDKHTKTGLTSACYECNRPVLLASQKRARQRNPQAHVARTKQWRANNPVLHMLQRARARARSEGASFDLVESDVVVPAVCPVFGVTLVQAKGQHRPNSPSLDRIVPVLGYTKNNVVVMSSKANLMKNDATIAELRQFAAWVIKTYGA